MKHLALIVALLLGTTGPLWASELRAVLIGVTDYDPSVEALAPRLQGPGHDVALMFDTLRRKGVPVSAIAVLSDRPGLLRDAGPVGAPTRHAILSALDALARTATQDSDILIYFAGHGAQIARAGGADATETDGLDEVLLPADFRITSDAARFVNHITDDEIGARIDRMIAKGAQVWLVADACHSGTLRRSTGGDAVPRFVDLGFAPVPDSPPQTPLYAPPARNQAGGFVGFYAATAGDAAYEVAIEDNVHGLLTWSLARALRRADAAQFSDLARAVSGDLWRHGQGRARPEFAGNLGAPQFFETGPRAASLGLDWNEETGALRLRGGRVDGLLPGTRVAILGERAGPLFSADIRQAGLTYADLTVPIGETPGLDAAIRAEGLDPERFRLRWLQDRAPGLRATVVSRPMDLDLAVQLPPEGTLPEAIRAVLMARIPATPGLRLAGPGSDRVRLRAEAGRLWLDPADPGAAEALSVAIDPAAMPVLIAHLRRMAKSRALLEVATALQEAPVSNQIAARIEVGAGQRGADGFCLAPGMLRQPETPPLSRDCDQITLRLENRGPDTLDLTPLYLAPDHQVYFLSGYTGSPEGGLRLKPGAQGTIRYTELTRAQDGQVLATGMMHLLVLAVVSDASWPPRDFRHLQQIAPPPLTRSASADPLDQLLNAAAFATGLRSALSRRDTGGAGAIVIPLRTIAENRMAERE